MDLNPGVESTANILRGRARKKDVEILFCYESYDELVLMHLQQFDKVQYVTLYCGIL